MVFKCRYVETWKIFWLFWILIIIILLKMIYCIYMYYTLQNEFPNENKKDFCIKQTFYPEKMKKTTEKMHFRYGQSLHLSVGDQTKTQCRWTCPTNPYLVSRRTFCSVCLTSGTLSRAVIFFRYTNDSFLRDFSLKQWLKNQFWIMMEQCVKS